MIKLSSQDLATLLLCSMRYAIGRMTYMPSNVARMIRESWGKLSQNDRDLLKRDLKDEIQFRERGFEDDQWKGLGHECDYHTWHDLMKWMEER